MPETELAPSIGKGETSAEGFVDEGQKLPRELIDPFKVLDKPNILPGWEGAPFRGSAIPDIKEDDPFHKQPQMAMQARVRIFEMNNPKHMTEYTEILQVIANGFGQLGAEERVYAEDIKSWRIFIRWWQVFSHMKDQRSK